MSLPGNQAWNDKCTLAKVMVNDNVSWERQWNEMHCSNGQKVDAHGLPVLIYKIHKTNDFLMILPKNKLLVNFGGWYTITSLFWKLVNRKNEEFALLIDVYLIETE